MELEDPGADITLQKLSLSSGKKAFSTRGIMGVGLRGDARMLRSSWTCYNRILLLQMASKWPQEPRELGPGCSSQDSNNENGKRRVGGRGAAFATRDTLSVPQTF